MRFATLGALRSWAAGLGRGAIAHRVRRGCVVPLLRGVCQVGPVAAAAEPPHRRRDAALQAAGYRVVRFTWRQITRESHAGVAMLANLLRNYAE